MVVKWYEFWLLEYRGNVKKIEQMGKQRKPQKYGKNTYVRTCVDDVTLATIDTNHGKLVFGFVPPKKLPKVGERIYFSANWMLSLGELHNFKKRQIESIHEIKRYEIIK